MNADEESGLRAFVVDVAASNESGLQRPTDLRIHDSRISVGAVLATWREEERIGFRVVLENGQGWLLYYVPELDLWSGFAEAGVGPATVEPRRRERPVTGEA